jgi:hypothetical protein
MPTEPTEQVDHKVEALRWLDSADREGCDQNHRAAEAFSAVAQTHASLAIAEELQGVRRVLTAMHQGAPIDAVEAQEAAASPIPRRERAVNELFELAKLADNEVMKGELEGLASRFSLPPVGGDRV